MGIVCYELLLGLIPVKSRLSRTVVVEEIARDLPALGKYAPEIIPALGALLMHMLAEDPAERPGMEGVVTTLRQLFARSLKKTMPIPEVVQRATVSIHNRRI